MGQELLRARRFTVERREYNVPGLGPVHGELVVHPGAVGILPMLSPDEVVLIRNYRFSVGRELLEIPAGTLEPGEEPIACAARELEEEAGYVADSLEPLVQFYTTPGFTTELMHVFVATGLTHRGQKCEATEQIRVAPMPLAEAMEACLDGRITDGKTIATLGVYHYRRTRTT